MPSSSCAKQRTTVISTAPLHRLSSSGGLCSSSFHVRRSPVTGTAPREIRFPPPHLQHHCELLSGLQGRVFRRSRPRKSCSSVRKSFPIHPPPLLVSSDDVASPRASNRPSTVASYAENRPARDPIGPGRRQVGRNRAKGEKKALLAEAGMDSLMRYLPGLL
ncbi:hypothetical protein ASPZODRAFT_14866 [Penicilliopsis zonata CBS 506.65]|uniref:Uncharacterized protein n=1 Tax=Penicilliopsis zonata CBS 506.65 TaxID=1073090 RepID=A0A1L9SNQ6_9EURO|nr:hypothetical protein ASPZODRAFT_14866 [Penicilliopsis zonata CBS 506.65]OJJ48741.1 hypothetical protein ASPZODRAFT_14866 [Penicilliopsis zonata CBS 506.65]